MQLTKKSEKIVIWMFRNDIKQVDVAKKLNTSRQNFARKLKKNDFNGCDMLHLKLMGYED